MLKKIFASVLIVFIISFSIDSSVKDAQAVIVIDDVLVGGAICALIASGVVFANSTQAQATARSFINNVIANGSSDLNDLRVAAGQTLTIAAATAIAIKQFNSYLTGQVRTPTDQITWTASGAPINFPVGVTTVIPNTQSTPVSKGGSTWTEALTPQINVNIPVGTAGVASTLANIYIQIYQNSAWAQTGPFVLKQSSTGVISVDATGYWSGTITNLVNGTNYTISNGMITLALGSTLTVYSGMNDKVFWTIGGTSSGSSGMLAPFTTQWAINPVLQQANEIPITTTTATIGQNTTIDGTKSQTDLTGATLQVLQQSAVANATTANLTLQLVNETAISNGFLSSISTGISSLTNALSLNGTGDAIDTSPLRLAVSTFTTKFPFSLPWDFLNMLQSLGTATTISPTFNISIDAGIFKWNQTLDFSLFNPIMGTVRTFLDVGFSIGLLFSTRKLLGGAT